MQEQWEDPKPGFRWPISVAQEIASPTMKVWAAISIPGNLELCHPFCARNPVTKWPGEHSLDEIHYLSGWVYERRFCTWIEGIGYDLEIGRPGGQRSFVSWRIKPTYDEKTVLRIAVYPATLQHLPISIRWAPHTLLLAPRLKSYLSSVTRGFAWYLEQGKPVRPNQFGSHPWFSASRATSNAT